MVTKRTTRVKRFATARLTDAQRHPYVDNKSSATQLHHRRSNDTPSSHQHCVENTPAIRKLVRHQCLTHTARLHRRHTHIGSIPHLAHNSRAPGGPTLSQLYANNTTIAPLRHSNHTSLPHHRCSSSTSISRHKHIMIAHTDTLHAHHKCINTSPAHQ